jgi:hypothetical protein
LHKKAFQERNMHIAVTHKRSSKRFCAGFCLPIVYGTVLAFVTAMPASGQSAAPGSATEARLRITVQVVPMVYAQAAVRNGDQSSASIIYNLPIAPVAMSMTEEVHQVNIPGAAGESLVKTTTVVPQ